MAFFPTGRIVLERRSDETIAVADGGTSLPTFEEAGAGASLDGIGSVAVPYPVTGLLSGDLFILQVSNTQASNCNSSTPSGFTLLFGPDAYGTLVEQTLYYRVSNGTESGNVTVSYSTDSSSLVAKANRMYRYRGVASSSFTEGGGVLADAVASITHNSVTSSAANRLAVSFVTLRNDIAMASYTGETGGDFTESVAEFSFTSADQDISIQTQDADMATAGTISGGSFTGDGSPWVTRTFALIPG